MPKPLHANASRLELLSSLSEAERVEYFSGLSEAEAEATLYDWSLNARVNQRIPEGLWTLWCILAGRGFGKTRTGAETVREWVDQGYKRIHLVGATASDARDVMVQGESGLLSVFPPHQRPLYEPSKRLITFHTGAVAITFSADEPERLRGPQCLAGGSMILMGDGSEKRICDVVPGDRVTTRRGSRVVKRAWMSSTSAEVHLLKLVDGRSILATGEHPVCVTPVLNTEAESGTSDQGEVITKPECCSIERFGQPRMVRYRTDTTFITVTEISTIIASRTSSCSVLQNTTGCTAGKSSIHTRRKPRRTQRPRSSEIEQPASSTEDSPVVFAEDITEAEPKPQQPIARGLVSRDSGEPYSPREAGPVSNAAQSTNRLEQHSVTVEGGVIKQPAQLEPFSRETLCAITVGSYSKAVEATLDFALDRAPCLFMTPIESVEAYQKPLPVYDLEIEGEHEFFANGILVHNCEAFWADELVAWRFGQDAWDNLMFGFRLGSDPRGIITTTPKPIQLLKDILASPSTIITRGSSYENRGNLAPAFFQTIIRKYEGTRLGRQELNAELLEDVPGALWTLRLIDAFRVKQIPTDEFVRIVVGVDPAVTSHEYSDDTGIVVCGLMRNGHVVVLEDLSCKESPLEWARIAISAYRRWRADRIVGEVNKGGDLVGATIQAVAPDVAFRAVRASRGKMIRAEPVAALYEQGRVHHYGSFDKLEDQMCNWTQDTEFRGTVGRSPDRMDALVWAITDLLIDLDDTPSYNPMFQRVQISRF